MLILFGCFVVYLISAALALYVALCLVKMNKED